MKQPLSKTSGQLEKDEYLNEIPDEVEMPLLDHIEELRMRILYSLVAICFNVILCFIIIKPLVRWLEVPAQGVKLLQLAPGEFFFVSIKVAGYSGLLISSPFIIYQVLKFTLPGLTRRERQLIGPTILASSVLFFAGIGFSYWILIQAALNFFITYGSNVVEQAWSIDRYFEFILLLMFSTGIAFQIPVIQLILGYLGIISSQQMLKEWRIIVVGAVILGAVLTPSTDPLTQSLFAGAVLGLYFSGIFIVKLSGR